MADLKQLQDAMLVTLDNMGTALQKKEKSIEILRDQLKQETSEFDRLFQSFLSLTGQKETPYTYGIDKIDHLPVDIQHTQQQVQDILKTQQRVMQQANPPQVKMPKAPPSNNIN